MLKYLPMKVVVDIKDRIELTLSNHIRNLKDNPTENQERNDHIDRLSNQLVQLKLATAKGNQKRRTLLGLIPISKSISYYIFKRSELKRLCDVYKSSKLSNTRKTFLVNKYTREIKEIDDKLILLNANTRIFVTLDKVLNISTK